MDLHQKYPYVEKEAKGARERKRVGRREDERKQYDGRDSTSGYMMDEREDGDKRRIRNTMHDKTDGSTGGREI